MQVEGVQSLSRREQLLKLLGLVHNHLDFNENTSSKFIENLQAALLHFGRDTAPRFVFMICQFFEHEYTGESLNDWQSLVLEMLHLVDPLCKVQTTSHFASVAFVSAAIAIPTTLRASLFMKTSSRSDVERILFYFNEFEKLQKPKHVFMRSFYGATGITFLSSDWHFPWVIKWQGRMEAEAEYVCTELFRRTFPHLSIPKCFLENEALTRQVNQYAHRMKLQGVVFGGSQIPLIMQFKEGANLKDACEIAFQQYQRQQFEANAVPNSTATTHAASFLSATIGEQVEAVCVLFGEIAGYDFLFGNTDRFLPDNISQFDLATHYHKANGGNVMLELEENGSSLKMCHLIDLAPCFGSFFSLAEKKAAKFEKANGKKDEQGEDDEAETQASEAFLNEFSLFGQEEEEAKEEAEAKEEKKEEQKEKNKSGGIELRKRMEDAFVFFIESSVAQLQIIAKIIAVGIKNECKEVIKKKDARMEGHDQAIEHLYSIFEERIERSILKGLTTAKISILEQNDKLMSVLSHIEQERDYISTTQTLFVFIRDNLQYAVCSSRQSASSHLSMGKVR